MSKTLSERMVLYRAKERISQAECDRPRLSPYNGVNSQNKKAEPKALHSVKM